MKRLASGLLLTALLAVGCNQNSNSSGGSMTAGSETNAAGAPNSMNSAAPAENAGTNGMTTTNGMTGGESTNTPPQ